MTAPIRCPKCGEWLMPKIGSNGCHWVCRCGYNPNVCVATNRTNTETPTTTGTKTKIDGKAKEGDGE